MYWLWTDVTHSLTIFSYFQLSLVNVFDKFIIESENVVLVFLSERWIWLFFVAIIAAMDSPWIWRFFVTYELQIFRFLAAKNLLHYLSVCQSLFICLSYGIVGCLYVCPFLCLSVTWQYCVKCFDQLSSSRCWQWPSETLMKLPCVITLHRSARHTSGRKSLWCCIGNSMK